MTCFHGIDNGGCVICWEAGQARRVALELAAYPLLSAGPEHAQIDELEKRIARKEQTITVLTERLLATEAKVAAAMIQAATARAEAQRLSDLLVKQEQELATLRPKPAPAPEHPLLRAIRRGA